VPRSWVWLAASQFMLLVAVTAYFLFLQATLSVSIQWVLGALIIWWVMDLGVMMEGLTWSLVSEIMRSMVLILVIASIGLGPMMIGMIVIAALLVIPTASLIWSRRPLRGYTIWT